MNSNRLREFGSDLSQLLHEAAVSQFTSTEATQLRNQATISQAARVSGFGLFSGADVELEFCPAGANHGIVFEQTDLPTPVRIPALIEFVVAQPRCTVIENSGVRVSVIEHVMAALAGLKIDNCLIRLNASEPPGSDGSSQAFVDALTAAGRVELDVQRPTVCIDQTLLVTEGDSVGVGVQPPRDGELEIGFYLDYDAPLIGQQINRFQIDPETFKRELAASRTFVMQDEISALQQQGIGCRATSENVVVFTNSGVLDSTLRFDDECVRHKILDCLGDFALLGCDIAGRFTAIRSGHRLNHSMIRRIQDVYSVTESFRSGTPQRMVSNIAS